MAAGGLAEAREGDVARAPADASAARLCLPPIIVRTEADAVAKFRRETGAPAIEGLVPLTFPFCWLTLPAIRPMIREMIGGDDVLPVHEAQSFSYERSLEIDSDYVFAVELRREANPPRLNLDAAISTPQGEICGRLETVLRLVPIASGSAP
ncbi:hypothetical protein RZS28_10435 [Methylocapsa polymorpha]|uniref:Uncharacterized protein n=1 Tax=Methylocapsa polymorpha TaxID=3080828 RepID=A0ABZ0HNB6_9HYPH|nr:hypothetical protein RZS28_10435 [Methylocapsa sp. RX1]